MSASEKLVSEVGPIENEAVPESIPLQTIDKELQPTQPSQPSFGYGHHYVFAILKRERPLPSKPQYYLMLFALFLVMFLAGWNDASQGPLLPSLQIYYGIDYLVISIIWVFNAIGFVLSGLTNVFLTDRFGFGIVTPLGSFMQALGYALMCWGGPYPLFCFAFVLNGFGIGIQDAQVNALVSRLPNASTKMFLTHAVYGFGATISPLVSTEFVKVIDSRVYLYYAVSLGLAAMTALIIVVVFQGRTEDQVVGRRDDVRAELPQELPTTDAPMPQPADKVKVTTSSDKMRRIMRIPAVHLMAFYILLYVGFEVTVGGWATTFIINERHGSDNAGYVSSGYFGGLTLGRVALIPVTSWMGGANAIYVYSVIAIALEIIIWTVRSVIGDAIAFAFVGVFFGPMYPIVMMVVVDIIPGELQSGTIGWIASLGQLGSAMMPFITGGLSQKYGVWILQPVIIAFVGASLILWALVPRSRQRIAG